MNGAIILKDLESVAANQYPDDVEVRQSTLLALIMALRLAEKGLGEAEYQLGRIEHADWVAEQMRLGAKSGGFQMRKARAEIAKLVDMKEQT